MMTNDIDPGDTSAQPAINARANARRKRLRMLLWLLLVWGIAAYLVVPRLWELYFHRHADYSNVGRITTTSDGHPGDPVNIALIGSESELVRGMTAAGWYPADPITLGTSVRIAADSVLRRSDDDAPVSDLFLFGRKQDLAFEQPVGDGPRQRHHVRYWRWDKLQDGKPVWFGSATFDERVGLSYTTGQVTHHIGPDVDAERDRIASELTAAGCAGAVDLVDGFHAELSGRNGGGDPWHTDGRLAEVVLQTCATPEAGARKP
jgi:LssY C-terminus